MALYWILSFESEEDSPTTRFRRREHMMTSKPRLQPASDLELRLLKLLVRAVVERLSVGAKNQANLIKVRQSRK